MKIGIDAQPLARQNYTGVDYYVLNITQQLIDLSPDDEFELCYFGNSTTKMPLTGKNVRRRPIKLPRRLYQAFLRYLVAPPIDWLAHSRTDLFIFGDFVSLPLRYARKQIVVIHDLGYLEVPETMTPRLRRYLTRFVPKSIKRASAVVAVSSSTKQQIIDHYGTPADKISIASPAIDHSQYKPSTAGEIEQITKNYKIQGSYILFLGTIEPRKNIVGLLEAYAALPESLQKSHQLVLAGGKGWLDENIMSLVNKLGDRVVQTGYFQDADKAALYSGASVFVYPSFYEGWGMQPLEAMACGTPVITSDNSSLPEVVGDAAILINANDTSAIAGAMQRVLTDEELAAELRQKGFDRAKASSWTASASAMKRVIDSLR